jgi:hypothetical protein
MSALVIGAIVFACVFGGALFGMFLRTVLPEAHLSPDAGDHQGVDGQQVSHLVGTIARYQGRSVSS